MAIFICWPSYLLPNDLGFRRYIQKYAQSCILLLIMRSQLSMLTEWVNA